MVDIRQTQDIVEIMDDSSAEVRQTQNIVEILSHTTIPVRQTQNIVELLYHSHIPVRQTQNIIEIMYRERDLSGIYWINRSITRDTYYTTTKKIPNPTIRTALFGE